MFEHFPLLKSDLLIGFALGCVLLLYFKLAQREADRRRFKRSQQRSRGASRATRLEPGPHKNPEVRATAELAQNRFA